MKGLLPIRAGPTLLERVAALIDCLEDIRSRFKEAVVRFVGRSIADAVSELFRRLMGVLVAKPASDDAYFEVEPNDGWQDDDSSLDASIPVRLPDRHEPTTGGYVRLSLSWLALLLSWLTTLLA